MKTGRISVSKMSIRHKKRLSLFFDRSEKWNRADRGDLIADFCELSESTSEEGKKKKKKDYL